jgi:DNA replicative helicase MCM subunit Mcm2 (Cdc46/Mcm family)
MCANLLVRAALAMLCADFTAVLVAAPLQVLLYSSQPFGPCSMRELNSNRVSQLVQISGIITSASKPKVWLVLQLRLAFVVCHAVHQHMMWMALPPQQPFWSTVEGLCSSRAAVPTCALPAAGQLTCTANTCYSGNTQAELATNAAYSNLCCSCCLRVS